MRQSLWGLERKAGDVRASAGPQLDDRGGLCAGRSTQVELGSFPGNRGWGQHRVDVNGRGVGERSLGADGGFWRVFRDRQMPTRC